MSEGGGGVSHDDLQAMAGSYALGALDGEDLAAFQRHLPACFACRQRVMEFEEVYAEGALGLAPVEPSPDLRGRLLDRIAARPAGETGPDAGAAGAGAGAATRGAVLPWAGLAAAGLLAAVLLVLYAGAEGRARRLGDDLAAAEAALAAQETQAADRRARIAEVEARLDALEARLAATEGVGALVADPATRLTALAGAGPAAAARGRVIWRGEELGLVAAGLPEPPAGQAYALWTLRDGEPRLAGAAAAPGGDAVATFTLDAPLAPDDAFAVTLEPIPAGAVPTGEVHLASP